MAKWGTKNLSPTTILEDAFKKQNKGAIVTANNQIVVADKEKTVVITVTKRKKKK